MPFPITEMEPYGLRQPIDAANELELPKDVSALS
jgi:hypothetical protein